MKDKNNITLDQLSKMTDIEGIDIFNIIKDDVEFKVINEKLMILDKKQSLFLIKKHYDILKYT